ncbi:unnamed protein product [Prunus armeniaca]
MEEFRGIGFGQFLAGMVWYTLALPGASEPGCLQIGAPEGVPLAGPRLAVGLVAPRSATSPAGPRLAVGLVAPRSATSPAGPLEWGVRPLRPSWVVPNMRRRFDRGSYDS